MYQIYYKEIIKAKNLATDCWPPEPTLRSPGVEGSRWPRSSHKKCVSNCISCLRTRMLLRHVLLWYSHYCCFNALFDMKTCFYLKAILSWYNITVAWTSNTTFCEYCIYIYISHKWHTTACHKKKALDSSCAVLNTFSLCLLSMSPVFSEDVSNVSRSRERLFLYSWQPVHLSLHFSLSLLKTWLLWAAVQQHTHSHEASSEPCCAFFSIVFSRFMTLKQTGLSNNSLTWYST